MHHNTSGLGRQSGGAEGSGLSANMAPSTQADVPREGDDVAASEGAEDPWMAWYRQNEDSSSNAGSQGWAWNHGNWHHGWHERRWERPETDSEDEEAAIEVLPDVRKGGLLLEKAGLDPLEKSIIQSDIKSRFSLQSVENALRAPWTDEQVRKRDGESRGQANFEDLDVDDDAPQEVDDSFFEQWDEADVALYQAAQQTEAEAWAQIQQGRRLWDPGSGATRTMGSITALEHARAASWAHNKRNNIAEIDPENRPTFGFADSESARCSSTVLMQLAVQEQKMRLKVHALQ